MILFMVSSFLNLGSCAVIVRYDSRADALEAERARVATASSDSYMDQEKEAEKLKESVAKSSAGVASDRTVTEGRDGDQLRLSYFC